jgi:acetyltransferase-like isoleucine patch superfamily enzyme
MVVMKVAISVPPGEAVFGGRILSRQSGPGVGQQQEFARPICIGSDVWVGGGAILCPGVRIGSMAVIGAGSVVTRDILESVFAAGNPCRVIREISE